MAEGRLAGLKIGIPSNRNMPLRLQVEVVLLENVKRFQSFSGQVEPYTSAGILCSKNQISGSSPSIIPAPPLIL